MSSTSPAAASSVSTAGAWLGVGAAAFATAYVVACAAAVAGVAAISLIVDGVGRRLERDAASVGTAPQFDAVVDRWLEVADALRPWSSAAGWSGVALGLALFFAATRLTRGREFGRRATRALLVAGALHAAAASAWLVLIAFGPLGQWRGAYAVARKTALEATGPGQWFLPTGGFVPAATHVIPYVAAGFVGVLVAVALHRAAGRASIRAWCAAPESKRPPGIAPERPI